MAREPNPAVPAERDGSPDMEEHDEERAVKQLMRHLLSKPPEPRNREQGPKSPAGSTGTEATIPRVATVRSRGTKKP